MMLRKSQSLVPERPRPAGVDHRLARVGWELWREDEEGLKAALREVGAWPDRGMLVENLTGERLFGTVSLFVQKVRAKGWPEDPGAILGWSENQGMGVRGPAWHEERKRRDSRRRPGLEFVQGRASGAFAAAGVEPSALLVPGEEAPVDCDWQMEELERQLALRGLARPVPMEPKEPPPPDGEFAESPPPGWDETVQNGGYPE